MNMLREISLGVNRDDGKKEVRSAIKAAKPARPRQAVKSAPRFDRDFPIRKETRLKTGYPQLPHKLDL